MPTLLAGRQCHSSQPEEARELEGDKEGERMFSSSGSDGKHRFDVGGRCPDSAAYYRRFFPDNMCDRGPQTVAPVSANDDNLNG